MLRELTMEEVSYVSGGDGEGGGGGININLNFDMAEIIRIAMEWWNTPTDEEAVHAQYDPFDGNGFTTETGWAYQYDPEKGGWIVFRDVDGNGLYDEMFRRDDNGDWFRSTDGESWQRYLYSQGGQTMQTVGE